MVKKAKMGKCDYCGKEFKLSQSHIWRMKNKPSKNIFCSKPCHYDFELRENRAYSDMPNRKLPDKWRCYLKEARAILEGKDTKGKNRCTKLEGDE